MDADAILAALFTEQGRTDPYPYYTALHELGRISSVTPAAASYVAVVNGYDQVDQVLRDPAFLKQPGRADWEEHPVLAVLQRSMMFSNPPEHAHRRKVFQQVFTPRRVAELEPKIHQIVAKLLDRMAELGQGGAPVDFISEFAYPLPTQVVGELLGIPLDDLGWFRERVERIDAYLDLAGKTPEILAAADAAATELSEYYAGLIAKRRADPRDDLVSALVQAMDAGDEPLTDPELVSNLVVLFNASFVTTINLLGNGLPPLLARPDLVAALPGDPALASACVEEVLRYDSSVQFLARAASVDTVVGDLSIVAGSNVLLLLGAANRDPRRYPDPDLFDPSRPDIKPVSFGAGAHYCLGAALSRAEGRIAFQGLFERFPSLSLATEPVRSEQFLLRGFSEIPVVFRAA